MKGFISARAKKFPDRFITDCKDCKRDSECCKVPRRLYEKEVEIIRALAKKHGKKVDIIPDKKEGEYVWQDVPCIFFNKEKCDIHENRPVKCRTYFCGDWGFSSKEKEKIIEEALRYLSDLDSPVSG